jgi:hypothetical protein
VGGGWTIRVGVLEGSVVWFVRTVTCICVRSVSLFSVMVGVLIVLGCFTRLLSSLRASSSSIYWIRMASALSKGSCGGTDFACIVNFSTCACDFWVVCLVVTCTFPFVICWTGGVVAWCI